MECLMCSKWYVRWPLRCRQIPCLRMTTRTNLKLRIKSSVTLPRTRWYFLSFIAFLKNNLPTTQCGPTWWCRTKENSVICADDFPHRISSCNKILLSLPASFFPHFLLYLPREYIACYRIQRPTTTSIHCYITEGIKATSDPQSFPFQATVRSLTL